MRLFSPIPRGKFLGFRESRTIIERLSTVAALAMGTASECEILDVVPPWVGIVVRISKDVLACTGRSLTNSVEPGTVADKRRDGLAWFARWRLLASYNAVPPFFGGRAPWFLNHAYIALMLKSTIKPSATSCP